jgi:hypothetical protein
MTAALRTVTSAGRNANNARPTLFGNGDGRYEYMGIPSTEG